MRSHRQNRRNLPLQVESLESMTLLSGLAAPAISQAPALVSAAATALTLSGKTSGTFYTSQSNPDTGKDYHVFALGMTSGGSLLAAIGDLVTPGFVAKGKTTGPLTVFTLKGSLTLSVTSNPQAGFSSLPSLLGFTITGGTGAFATNHTGSGTIAVTDHVVGTTAGSFSQSGTITLIFKGGATLT